NEGGGEDVLGVVNPVVLVGSPATRPNSTTGARNSRTDGRRRPASIARTASQVTPAATSTPQTTIAAPATRATWAPAGPTFSIRTNAVRAATHARFITPTTNSTLISAQQHPRQ